MFAKTMTIRTKLTLAFGLLAALVLILSAISLKSLTEEHDRFTDFAEQSSARLVLVHQALDAANARAIAVRNLVLITKDSERAPETAALTSAHGRLHDTLDRLKESVAKGTNVTSDEHQRFDDLSAAEARYAPIALDIAGLIANGKRDEAIDKMNVDCRPALAALVRAADAYANTISTQTATQVEGAAGAYRFARSFLIGICVLAIILAVGLVIVILRSITRPIDQAVGIAQAVASGNLTVEISDHDETEIGKLLGALKTMTERLRSVVGSARQSSDSIATGSAQIASGNADLSQRTEEQAANLQQTAASMEEMTATVRNSAQTAQEAARLAATASQAAQRGGETVTRVVQTMQDISASSAKISDNIGVIDGIAFQTNILALNAAVEAARARDQGRGFAVVAAEVRSLARRSSEAAKEIKILINDSAERVAAGSQLVGEAGTSMEDIVGQIKRVAGLIGEISTVTAEQTSGISQVSDAVSQMDTVTQQNAALVEESAAAAESLKTQAAMLAELVAVFKVDLSGLTPAGSFA